MEPAPAPQPGRGSGARRPRLTRGTRRGRAAIAQRPGTALVKDGRAVLVHLADGADGRAGRRGDARQAPLEPDRARRSSTPTAPNCPTTNCASASGRSSCRSMRGPGGCGRARRLRRRLQGRDRRADALSVAAPGLLPDALGGARRAEPQLRSPLIGALLCVAAFFLFWEGRYWAGCAAGLRLHGARHGRRQAGALHRPIVEVGQYLRPWHRPRPPALLVVGVGRGAGLHGPLLKQGYPGLEPVYQALVHRRDRRRLYRRSA